MVRYPLNDPVHTRILRGGRGGVCIAVYIAVCAGSTHAMLSDRLPFEHLRHQVRWIRCVAFPPGSHRAAPTKPTARSAERPLHVSRRVDCTLEWCDVHR